MKKMIWYIDNKTDNYDNKNNNNNINRKYNLNRVNNKDYERPFLLNYKFKIDNGTKDTNKKENNLWKIDFQKQGNNYKYSRGPVKSIICLKRKLL